ncbi:transcription factor IIF subunit tfg1 [Paramarasmius palmivorus]|uniref:Transcription factor IIF subunit tfg1 n=1 Tax=Paramarasmius palmivorus TaxID=297713 RepID=A0AAW0DH32_9AGAR
MAPREPSMALLFHPKKNKNKKQTPTASPSPRPHKPSSPANASTPPNVKPETSSSSIDTPKPSQSQPSSQSEADVDPDTFQLPTGQFQEFKLMSSALNGWKFDVMKFDSRKVVDLNTWQQPVKLNRKDLRRDDGPAPTVGPAVRPMLGLDGQQVFGADGKPVMVDAEGRPVVDNTTSNNGLNGKGGKGPNAKKKFQKKTKQVFIVPEEIRALRKEERYPWVMEDSAGQETWVGQLDEISKSETHAFFMPAAMGEIFKFVPSHRWYRFQKKLKHDLPTDTQTVESAYQQSQKRDPTAWLRQRNGKGPSSATAAMFKAEADGHIPNGGSGSLVQHSSNSLGPGGRKLKTVDHGGGGLFGDDDEDGDYKRRPRDTGGEGDLDENEYEEEFADDEEKMEVDDNQDDEAKELEERLKREYKNANKTREGYIDESDEEEEKPQISKSGKAMKKMLKTREGDAYESEEDENPYASSQEEEEEEEVPPPTNEPAVQQQPQQIKPKTEPIEPSIPSPASPQAQNGTPQPASPTSPSLGGHSVVAKRATSPPLPKAPKLKTASRAGSPLAGGGSRAGSPVAGAGGSRAGSPVAASVNGQKKRKAEDSMPSPTSPNSASNPGAMQPKPKKRKAQGAVAQPTGPLEDWMLIDWLKNTPNASTRECIQYFTPYLTDEKEKTRFTGLVKEFATLKNGVLTLRSSYANRGSAGPSTTA